MRSYAKEIFAIGVLTAAGALYHGFDLDHQAKNASLPGLPQVMEKLIPEKIQPLMAHPEVVRSPASEPHPQVTIAAVPAPVIERLREFGGFQRKALLLDEERLRKQEILEDPQFLHQLGDLLKDSLQGSEMEHALDLLLEARRYSEFAAVDEVLKGIVQDARVEDLSLPYRERERLAELKAEVMYHWSAVDTRASQQISSVLPGEVSHRIWRNVVELQEQNFEESKAMQKRFASTGSHFSEMPGVE